MTHKALLRRPGGFLGLFALVTALSLLAWDVLPAYYLQAIIWLVNGGLVLLNPATVLRLPASLLHDGVYLGIAGAIALFLVTPRQTWRWRLRWMGLLMAVMLALHAAVLLAETMNAIQGLSTAPLPLRLADNSSAADSRGEHVRQPVTTLHPHGLNWQTFTPEH
jgi:hypothetical protein